MSQITHYILGCPTNEPESNDHIPWNYLTLKGDMYRNKFLVRGTCEYPEQAQQYLILSVAMTRREMLWGPGWEVLAMPALEIIDHKLYAQQNQKPSAT